jgi:Transposase DDE domain group 1
MVKRNRRRPSVKITGGGTGVVNHAGARLLFDLADEVGLSSALSAAMAPTKQRRGGHDRGEVLVDVAVMLADGGDTISDVAVLRDQPDLFGDVASHATVWRTLDAVDTITLERIKVARAQARAKAWTAGADPGFYVIDIDATLVGAHSEKEQAAPTYKRGFGFHPLLAYLDATGEALAGVLRPGNAGSGTATDHVAVLDDALAQLPIDPAEVEVIARADSAGWSHVFVEHCRSRRVRFVIGHQLTVDIAKVLVDVPERAWQPALSADGAELREHAEVVEITDLVDLSGWPQGCRMIARREDPHPGAQLTFTDIDGHRYQVFVTDLADPDIAYLEALYRGRGRAERQICDTKATGLTNLPSHSFTINTAWLQLTLVAHDLLAWTRLLTLDSDLASAEPKRLRYCLFHTAGHIITTARQRLCHLSATWPWTSDLVAAFTRLHTLPLRS